MNQPLLSIVIVMHNNAGTLERCINSFYSYIESKPIEVICVDDHSTDNSIEIVKKYNSVSVYHLNGHGAGLNRNCGISHSQGKYIWFIDADDEVDGSKIQYLLHKLNDDKSIDLYVFGMMKINGNKKSIIMNDTDEIYHKEDDAKYLSSIFRNNTLNSPCNKIYKRSIILEHKLRFEDIPSGEDTLFNCKYLQYVRTIETLNKVLYLYYFYSDSSSKWKWNPNKEIITLKMLTVLNDFARTTKFMSSVIQSRIAADSLVGVEINILNKEKNFAFYKRQFRSKNMKKILGYCNPIQTSSFYYFVKSIIAKSLYLSYFYIKGIHNE